MDYWKDVPGINEEEIQAFDFDFRHLTKDIDIGISSLKTIKKNMLQNNPATAAQAMRNLMTSIKYINKILDELKATKGK